MTKHKQRNFVNQDASAFFQVDEEIYPLISALYKFGVTTLYSCQGDDVKQVEIDENNFYKKARELEYKRAYVMARFDDAADKLIGLFVEYFSKSITSHSYWTIEVSHAPQHGARVTFRFPKNEIEHFAWYIHEHGAKKQSAINKMKDAINGVKTKAS